MLCQIVRALLLTICATAAAAELLELHGEIEGVHDPALIKEKDVWYLFSTGSAKPGHIPIRCSTDLHNWKQCGHVFDEIPLWARNEIPKASSLWAPDISLHEGVYRLYYAVSTFGSNDSAIGLATNRTLDSKSPEYRWKDEGLVIRSRAGKDDWNAIDPNLADGEDGREWLVFGSFWGGIKMRQIEAATGKLSEKDPRFYSLAARPHGPGTPDAIEAPFLVQRGAYYYLFVSFDFCCRGAKSNYYVAVGRSQSITGPYIDESGKPMLEGGGTRVTEGTSLWRGPGHEAVLLGNPNDLLAYHAYDGVTGRPRLQLSTLTWEDGWPHAATLPETPAEAHYQRAFQLFREGKARESLIEFTEAAKYRKPNAQNLKIVALDYVLLNDLIDADRWLTKSVEWDPDDAEAWYHLGRTKYNENRFEEAVNAFEHCLAREPGNAKAQDNLGLSLEGLGRNDEAIGAYRKAIELQPESPEPYTNLGALLATTGHFAEAVAPLLEAIRLAPRDIKPHRELSKVYSGLNRLDDAQNELELAVRLEPNNGPLHFMLGQVLRRKGLKERAQAEFNRYQALKDAESKPAGK